MSDTPEPTIDRRPLATREVRVFQRFASWLARKEISPNVISVSSMVFGVAAGACLAATNFTEGWLCRGVWFAAAAMIQMRLLANMLDGMVAIEGGKTSPIGELFNEFPDRVSDGVILVGAGFASGGCPVLGFTAALLAVVVAYVRALGATTGVGQVFIGPMAKPQRMFVLTVVALYCALTPLTWQPVEPSTGWSVIGFALLLVIAGCIVTTIRRLSRIASMLRKEP